MDGEIDFVVEQGELKFLDEEAFAAGVVEGAVGDFVAGTGVPADTFITRINSSTSVTLSQAATVNAVEGLNNEISGTGYQILLTEVDPTTGLPRLIFGNNDGIWSVLDNNGSFENSVGSTDLTPGIDRNGNIQIAQFYSVSAQPSSVAAQAANALFYGAAQNTGVMSSSPGILTDGNLQWTQAPETENGLVVSDPVELMSATSVGVDGQGSGSLFSYTQPFAGAGEIREGQPD